MSSSDWIIARWMLILRPAIVTATLGVAALILPAGVLLGTPIAAVVIGAYVLTLLYWLAHVVSGISRLLLATQIGFDIFIITVIIHYTGGYDSSFVGFYLLSIMCASLFFGRLATMLFTTQAVVFYVVDLFFLGPLVPANLIENVFLQAILYSVLMYEIALLSSYFSEKVRGKDTALTHALKLLKEAKLDTWDILQSMTNGLITLDSGGRIIYMNGVAESILEVDRGTAVGKTCDAVLGERAGELVDVLRKQLEDPSPVFEKEIEVYDSEGNIIPLGLSSMPLYDTDGSRRGAIVNFQDLTEKKNLQEMLRQSERMAAIGELSAGIAHEIRNPLASICNAVELLTEHFDVKDGHDAKLLDVIEKESSRLQRISSDFLNFARIKNPDIAPVSLSSVIEEVLLLVENDPRKSDSITVRSDVTDGVTVLFDADQLRQLLLNLLINGLEALEGDGGEIVLSLDTLPLSAGEYVRLVVSDTGSGFPRGEIGSVFEPFFSTKPNGTGLGLALVRKLAVGNNGRVFARNGKNGGAEVILDMKANGDL